MLARDVVTPSLRRFGGWLLPLLRKRWRLLALLAALPVVPGLVKAIGVYWMERPVVPIGREHRQGRLLSRPSPPTAAPPARGHSLLGLAHFRDCVLYVPASLPSDRPVTLLLWLHGYGGGGPELPDEVVREAERSAAVVLAPQSRRVTWDAVRYKRFGPDVALIDAALRWVFARFAVDRGRITIAGNSDGASYALSLGLINGDLFHRIVAFAPELVRPGPTTGRPAIFIAHGRADKMHPIDKTSRPIVAQLRAQGYALTYEERDAGHDVVLQAISRGLADL